MTSAKIAVGESPSRIGLSDYAEIANNTNGLYIGHGRP